MKYLPFLLCLFLLSSCENKKEKEIGLIAEELKKSIATKDYTYLNNLASFERMMEKAYVRLRIPYKQMKESVRDIERRTSLSNHLTYNDDAIQLRVVSHDDKKITIAIQNDSLLVNYVDLVIKPIKEKLKITDFYFYQQGYSFSDEMQFFATIIKDHPDEIGDFNMFQKQVRMINIALLSNDVLTAKYYFKLIKDEYRKSKISESLHIAISSYDIHSDTDAILDKYIKEKPEQSKHGTYLKLMKYMYKYDCGGVKQQVEELWKYTGVDSVSLKYYQDCLDSKNYLVN
jgi:hypothetical protein